MKIILLLNAVAALAGCEGDGVVYQSPSYSPVAPEYSNDYGSTVIVGGGGYDRHYHHEEGYYHGGVHGGGYGNVGPHGSGYTHVGPRGAVHVSHHQ